MRSVPLEPFNGCDPIDGTAFTASSLVILPSFPVPFIAEVAIPFSDKTFLAAGEAVPVAYVAVGAAFGTSTLFSSFGASDFTGASPAGFAALVSIKHTTAPTSTASPSSAFKVIIPLSSAGNSKVALSESTSAIG